MKIRYSETFFSPQGEGKYCGHPSLWIRFAFCNLECHGFGQPDPTDPDTYILDFKDFDPEAQGIKKVEDLPVWTRGCDSSYTWAQKYAHLLKHKTVEEVVDELTDLMRSEYNPDGLFVNPHTGQDTHLCFTGGEPLYSQRELIEIMDEFIRRGNVPRHVTIETNTTRELSSKFIQAVGRWRNTDEMEELFFSCSPKLFSVSGEKPEKAIRPEIMESYQHLRTVCWGHKMQVNGQIKIVANGSERTWVEFEDAVQQFRNIGVTWPVYAMPVGATLEEQQVTAGDVAVQAIKRGYIVSARVHVYLFGNSIGT